MLAKKAPREETQSDSLHSLRGAMYSGSDSTESQNYTQWALNPSAYQNMSNEQVDWAALAQQWIIMKEAAIEAPIQKQITTAPPPPIISKPRKEPVAEGGEAPMDVENEDDGNWNETGSNDSYSWNPPAAPTSAQQPPPWGWNNSWPGAPAAVPPPNSVKAPLLPTPSYNTYNVAKEAPNDNNSFGYNSVPQTSPGYWTSAGSSKVIKPHNKRYSKVNVPVPAKAPMTLDAAKRKQLPAWIREGLEKMERDKIKQIDKNREKQEKNEYEEKIKLRENAMEILKSTVKQIEPKKLSAYADDDDSNEESPPIPPRRSPTPITYEDMMLKVRRTMTEILLKVTNREIQNICREELQRHVRKLKASNQRVSAPSGANLSAKLGLGAYAGSGESSSESDNDSNQGYQDSDSELRDIIRRRKEEFSKTERDIEDRLTEADKKDVSRATSPDSDSQVDAKVQERRQRRSEEGTPPPKANASHNSKVARKRQSSTSSASDSDKHSPKSITRSRDKRSSSSDRMRSKSKRSRSRTPKSLSTRKRRSDGGGKRSRSGSRRRGESRRDRRSSKYSRSRSRSRSYRRRNRSRSRSRSSYRSSKRSRSRSRSRSTRRYSRRSRSFSSGRGKRSHRH